MKELGRLLEDLSSPYKGQSPDRPETRRKWRSPMTLAAAVGLCCCSSRVQSRRRRRKEQKKQAAGGGNWMVAIGLAQGGERKK